MKSKRADRLFISFYSHAPLFLQERPFRILDKTFTTIHAKAIRDAFSGITSKDIIEIIVIPLKGRYQPLIWEIVNLSRTILK